MATPKVHLDGEARAEAPVEDALCDSCRTSVAHHDYVARRYCEATLRLALPRRCICQGQVADTDGDHGG